MSASLTIMQPLRALPLFKLPATIRPLVAARMYANQTGLGTSTATPKPRRKTVTTFNDDGRVAWGDLSVGEKAARTTQQTFNFGMIIIGTVLTGGVAYVLYTEVFSPDSKTAHFNRAADRVKADERCVQLLGASNKIRAFGEPTSSKWARAGPIASTTRTDQRGVQHLIMHFNVEGPLDHGVVNLHMTKRPSESDFAYKYLYLDVPGQQRIYLENADTSADGSRKSKTKFFGIEWTR